MIEGPKQVIDELNRLMREQEKGVQTLYEVEKKLAELEYELDTVEAKAFLKYSGTVEDRKRLALLEAGEARLARDVARAEVSRVKQKLNAIGQAVMATSVIAKQVELEWKR